MDFRSFCESGLGDMISGKANTRVPLLGEKKKV